MIRYSFLWGDDAAAGAEEGSKDRPCAIVLATARESSGEVTVLVAPITHAPPQDDASLETPDRVARTLRQDGERRWIRLDELNAFAWPGYDLRPIPGREGEYAYGLLPEALYRSLRSAILDRAKRRKARTQTRD